MAVISTRFSVPSLLPIRMLARTTGILLEGITISMVDDQANYMQLVHESGCHPVIILAMLGCLHVQLVT